MPLRLEIAGVAETRAKLAELVDRLDDLSGLWDAYAGVMIQTEEEWFASNGGGTWPPLADVTVREKIRMGVPLDTLIRTGDLLESLTTPLAMSVDQGRSTLGTFTRKAMTWGTDVRDDRGRAYAPYHQHQDPVTGEPFDFGRHPPERQVIPWPLPAHTQAQLASENERFVEEAIRESGLS